MSTQETLDEWIGKNAFGLGCDIATHLKVFGVVEDDCESCLRCIFISIRQWAEDKTITREKGKQK